ncbi:MAG: hypothetical protein AABY87_08030 [bacterium]
MKTVNVTLTVIALIIICADTAAAGSFAERFRRFVLGTEAEAYSVSMAQDQLDQVAEGCMGCHNGITATHITIKNAEAPLQIRGIQTVNHPVGMSYDNYALKNPSGFRPRSTLPSSIRMVDGKVTCLSCHRVGEERTEVLTDSRYDERRNGGCTASNILTVGPRETDLCMACHVK